MDNLVNDSLVYALADALCMPIEARRSAPRLKGEETRKVNLGGLEVPITVKIVSSLINRRNHMLLARGPGNMVLLVIASEEMPARVDTRLYVLNLAKMEKPENWLEFTQPSTPKVAENLLGKAIVRRFIRTGNSKWAAA